MICEASRLRLPASVTRGLVHVLDALVENALHYAPAGGAVTISFADGTIEAADALYGVTVGDDSVSRVISLRLDEARAIAERLLEEPIATFTKDEGKGSA